VCVCVCVESEGERGRECDVPRKGTDRFRHHAQNEAEQSKEKVENRK